MATRKPRSQSDKVRDLQAEREKRGAPAIARKDDGSPKNNLEAIREAEQAQLLSVMAKMRTATADVEAAMAIVKQKRDVVNSILDHAVAAGFKKGEIRELLKETAVTGSRKDLREAEERRARLREYLGLPVGTQPDLLDRMPAGAMDEIDWRGHGYAAGLRGDSCNPKEAGVPDRFHQAWMDEWGKGQEKIVWSLKATETPGASPSEKSTAPAKDIGDEVLEAISEVEPELVEQVVEDHGDDEAV